MSAYVAVAAGVLSIEKQIMTCPDRATLVLASSLALRHNLLSTSPSDPDPDWTLALALAPMLDGLAVPGDPPAPADDADDQPVY